MALLPVLLFAVLHAASYTLNMLDALGAPTSVWPVRMLISLVEMQSRNILRMVAFTEIFLLPITVLNVFRGVTWLVGPLVYYRFLGLRYSSRQVCSAIWCQFYFTLKSQMKLFIFLAARILIFMKLTMTKNFCIRVFSNEEKRKETLSFFLTYRYAVAISFHLILSRPKAGWA